MNPQNRKSPPFLFLQTPIPIIAIFKTDIAVRHRRVTVSASDHVSLFLNIQKCRQSKRKQPIYYSDIVIWRNVVLNFTKKDFKSLILSEIHTYQSLIRNNPKISFLIPNAASIEARKIMNVTVKYVTSDRYIYIKHKRNVSLQADQCRQLTYDKT